MFDIGFWELVLIGIVGLLVIGPERLPGFAREAGRWVRRVRQFSNVARRELQRELQWDEDDDPRREVDAVKNDLNRRISDMDRLMRDAPDRQPGWESDYTASGERKSETEQPDTVAPSTTDDDPADKTSVNETPSGDRDHDSQKS